MAVVVRMSSEMLVSLPVHLVHLRLWLVQGVHVVAAHVVIVPHHWRSVLTWLVEVILLKVILDVLLHGSAHFIRIVLRKLGREHEASVAVSCEWLLVVTDLIEGELHLCGNDQVVSVFDSHLGKTFGLSSHWLFSLDIDVHFFFLNKLSQFKVLHLGEDCLHQNLQSLVRANLNIEGFVQFVVQFRGFDSYVKAQVPSFFLSVGPLWVLGRTLVINHLIDLMNLSGLLLVQ